MSIDADRVFSILDSKRIEFIEQLYINPKKAIQLIDKDTDCMVAKSDHRRMTQTIRCIMLISCKPDWPCV